LFCLLLGFYYCVETEIAESTSIGFFLNLLKRLSRYTLISMSPLSLLRVEWIIALGLTAGAILARRGLYRAHGWLQGLLALINATLVIFRMIPAFRMQFGPSSGPPLLAWIHATAGGTAQLLGFYMILVAGLGWVPKGLAFVNYKAWMRATLTAWWITVALGSALYVLFNT
jgi:hypothetical protein